jgi:hypothetical protein
MKLKANTVIFYLFAFFQVIIIQFSTHHVETLDWDINAFLVTSLEFGRGNLPYEFQYENKPPLLFFLFYLFSIITENNLFFIKIINDFIIFLILIMMSNLYKKNVKSAYSKYTPPILFLLFTSNVWFHPNYSEYLVILFLALAQIFNNKNDSMFNIFLIGLSIGAASLINVGSVLFLISFIFIINLTRGVNLLKTVTLCCSFSIPHLLMISIYAYNNLITEYFMALIEVPLSYRSTSFSLTSALTVFFVAFENYNSYIYSLLLISIAFLIYKTVDKFRHKNYEYDYEFIEIVILCITSLLFFQIAGKGYYHHLLLFLYFLSFSTKWINKEKNKFIIIFIILISLIGVNRQTSPATFSNLRNVDNIQNNYPMFQIALNLKKDISKDDSIFSTNNILLLYYLDKPNSSYIVHPALFNYQEVTEILVKYEKIKDDELKDNIQKSPKIIELNTDEISLGEYKKLETTYIDSNLLNYWSKNNLLHIYIKR